MGTADCKEGGFADLEGVAQPLVEGRHVIFDLAEKLWIAIRVDLQYRAKACLDNS